MRPLPQESTPIPPGSSRSSMRFLLSCFICTKLLPGFLRIQAVLSGYIPFSRRSAEASEGDAQPSLAVLDSVVNLLLL
jgi:hypothetical protein